MNARMLEAALALADTAETISEIRAAATALRDALNAPNDIGVIFDEEGDPIFVPPSATVCGNCDSPLPLGCGGIFLDDGIACRLNHQQEN